MGYYRANSDYPIIERAEPGDYEEYKDLLKNSPNTPGLIGDNIPTKEFIENPDFIPVVGNPESSESAENSENITN